MQRMRVAATTAAVVSMVVAGATVWLTPATAATGVSMTVSKTTVLVGTKEHFSGHASGSGHKIALQHKAGKTWHNVASHHTDSSGNYKFAFIPAAPGHPTYRVAAINSRGRVTGASPSTRVTVLEWHYLSDLHPLGGSCGYTYGTAEVNGTTYPHTLFLESCNVSGPYEYNLERKCSTFTAVAGLSDSAPSDAVQEIDISADGNQLFSQQFGLGQSTPVSLHISGNLRLSMDSTRVSGGGTSPALGNARILCSF